MSSAPPRRLESTPRAVDAQRPVARVPSAEPDPAELVAALERRVAELSERLHAMTTERSIVGDELRLLRAGQKSAVEVAATLAARRIAPA